MSNTRIIIYGLLVLLVLVLVFYFMGKSLGKSQPPGQEKIPGDAPGGNQSPSVGDAQIRSIVDAMYEDIYSWWPRNSEPYVRLMALSDSDFVRAYNDWLDRYYKKDKETLRQALEGEYFSIFSTTFQNIAKPLMERFSRLGLK